MRAQGCREYVMQQKKFGAGSSSAKVEGPNRPAEVSILHGDAAENRYSMQRETTVCRVLHRLTIFKMLIMSSFPHFIPSLHIIRCMQ